MRLDYLLLFIAFGPVCIAQSAKDYFFPSPGKNKMIFGSAEIKNRPKNEMKTHVYFEDKGDSAVITTLYYNHQVIKDSWQQVVKIGESEISVINEKSNNSSRAQPFEANEFIIFKMPLQNRKVEWTHPRQKGTVIETFEAEFSTVVVDGQLKKAVKVTTNMKKRRSGKQLMSYVDYFVEGIGRYKRTSDSGLDVEILEEEAFDPKPPTVK